MQTKEHIDSIRNQAMEIVKLDTISDSEDLPGWNSTRRSDFVDIKLKDGRSIKKIQIVASSNVYSFSLKLKDINEKEIEIKVN